MNANELTQVVEYAKNALDMITTVLQAGGDVVAIIDTTKERLDAMVNQGRGPTPEEWEAQNAMRRDLSDRLQSDDR